MANNLTDTQQFDLLLKRINEVESVVENKIENMKTKESLSFFNPFIKHMNDGFIDIPPLFKTRNEFSELRHQTSLFLMNKDNTFDPELFKILKIKIKFNNSSWSRFSGTYSYDKVITINRAFNEGYGSKNTYTLRHEVGHAWHFQFSDLLGIDKWEMTRYFLIHYLKQLEPNIKSLSSMKFVDYKEMIIKHISKYGSKDNYECFAELFELGTRNKKEAEYNEFKWECAKNSLFSLNNWIKTKIWNNN